MKKEEFGYLAAPHLTNIAAAMNGGYEITIIARKKSEKGNAMIVTTEDNLDEIHYEVDELRKKRDAKRVSEQP